MLEFFKEESVELAALSLVITLRASCNLACTWSREGRADGFAAQQPLWQLPISVATVGGVSAGTTSRAPAATNMGTTTAALAKSANGVLRAQISHIVVPKAYTSVAIVHSSISITCAGFLPPPPPTPPPPLPELDFEVLSLLLMPFALWLLMNSSGAVHAGGNARAVVDEPAAAAAAVVVDDDGDAPAAIAALVLGKP